MSETVDSENEEGLVWQLIAGLQAEIATAKDRMVEMASEYEVVVAERDAAREALRPFGRLVVPQKPEGNAGIYSLFFKDIEAAREALSRSPEKP